MNPKNAELLQLQALLRKRRTSSVMFQTEAECFEDVGFQSNFHDLQTEPKQEKGEAAETEESNDSQQTRDNCSVPISNLKVWKQSHALDQKELPLEMKKKNFVHKVKKFFTHPVNLERQAKPLTILTYHIV